MADSGESTHPSAELVTVGVPTYNRCDSLMRATRSVLTQDYRPLRVLIADNASTDGTPDALRELAGRHPEVQLLLHERNAGPTANFESVREASSGDLFMWLGDDDWMGEGLLAACVEELRADPAAVMVAGAARYHAGDRNWLEAPLVDAHQSGGPARVLAYFRQVKGNGVFYGLIRRSALDRLPPLSNAMGGDWLLVAALAFLGKIRTIDRVEVHRSTGGATRSLADVARHQGLGLIPRHAPQVAIAWVVFADIAWRSPVYASLGRVGRSWLGLRAAAIIVRRFVPGAVVKYVGLSLRRILKPPTAPVTAA